MWHVHDGDVVHLKYRVVDTQTAVRWRGSAGYKFRDVNGSVVAEMWIVRTPGDAEAKSSATPLEHDLLVLPVIVSVHLYQEISPFKIMENYQKYY